MKYISTRDNSLKVSSAEAIVRGLSPDGGLFVPEVIPHFASGELEKLAGLTYPQLAADIMGRYLEDFSADELKSYTDAAYCPGRYDSYDTAPVRKADGMYFLELWHGPTCAFKDMALQMLPYLLTASMKKCGEERTVCILVATSGDTGKAALEGFRDVPGTCIMVFYPVDGVSDIQKLQMASQQGGNVSVVSVNGNFDDAQTGVKRIFSSVDIAAKIADSGYVLSSANSINWGRLLPQIVYYIWTYLRLVNRGEVKMGDPVDFCVPTGNFGDILAGWYAKQMGLPVGRLICASNKNDVLTQFIETGVYDRNRPFFLTTSPSMDILISSNLERLLFHLSGFDSDLVAGYMKALSTEGKYVVCDDIMKSLRADFAAASLSEEDTAAAIREMWNSDGYLIDTHTAVAYGAAKGMVASASMVIVSTASPYKFSPAVIAALGHEPDGSGIGDLEKLESLTAVPAPAPLAGLKGAAVRFDSCVQPMEMEQSVLSWLC